jgi:elongation factor G
MDSKQRLQKIRNIGFVAHIDAGKTTTTERVLFYSGRIHKAGETHDGTATTDWMDQEKERGITITSAATYCTWKNYEINIIDTPGHVDFTAEVERSLKVLDGCVVVLCAQGAVEPQSETVWRQADRYNVPRIVFVNKMDKVGADIFNCERELIEKLHANPVLLQVPIYRDEQFVGMVDLLKEKALFYRDAEGNQIDVEDVPEQEKELVAKYKERMIERLADHDDSIMERFLEGQDIPEAKLIDTIRKLTCGRKIIPVICGSSLKNIGVQICLDSICRYLPSPADIGEVDGFNEEDQPLKRKMDEDESFCGLCFKIMVDPYVGRLNFVRVYSGVFTPGSSVYNPTTRKTERVNKIVRMHANKQEIIDKAVTGDIVCFVGIKEVKTGDTLCDKSDPVVLQKIAFPEPVISQSIEPKTKAQQEKLGYSLSRLSEEDPTFRTTYNTETGQTIISGMGQLHLEVLIERLRREFGVETNVGNPQVAFKETISQKVNVVGKFISQSGGRGQYGHVVLTMEPSEEEGVQFENQIKGGSIPQEYIPGVKKGLDGASKNGMLGGYPVTNVKVTLVDGSYHEVDSSDLAFQMATSIGFKEGLQQGKSVLLEPIMRMEVTTPEDYLSSVMGDLNSRRARIHAIDDKRGAKIIRAEVPLRELFNYVDSLRNMTQGRGIYAMEPAFYDRVPQSMVEKILGK